MNIICRSCYIVGFATPLCFNLSAVPLFPRGKDLTLLVLHSVSVSFILMTRSLYNNYEKMMFVFVPACVCSVPLLEFVERYGAALQRPAHLLSHIHLHFFNKLTESLIKLKLLLK